MSATSCGPTFRTSFGAIRAGLNCSFGGFNGFAPVYLHEQFIGDMCRVPFPEPGSLALLGLGLVGLGLSRRRKP